MTRNILLRCWPAWLAFACITKAFAGGLSAWQATVPGGYELSHSGGQAHVVVLESADNVLLTRFYLYEGALVAEYDPSATNEPSSETTSVDSKRFYVVQRQKLQAFSEEEAFNDALAKTPRNVN